MTSGSQHADPTAAFDVEHECVDRTRRLCVEMEIARQDRLRLDTLDVSAAGSAQSPTCSARGDVEAAALMRPRPTDPQVQSGPRRLAMQRRHLVPQREQLNRRSSPHHAPGARQARTAAARPDRSPRTTSTTSRRSPQVADDQPPDRHEHGYWAPHAVPRDRSPGNGNTGPLITLSVRGILFQPLRRTPARPAAVASLPSIATVTATRCR
jgi:cell division protein FtsN